MCEKNKVKIDCMEKPINNNHRTIVTSVTSRSIKSWDWYLIRPYLCPSSSLTSIGTLLATSNFFENLEKTSRVLEPLCSKSTHSFAS